jgi:outer membrane protein assembly factor BamA
MESNNKIRVALVCLFLALVTRTHSISWAGQLDYQVFKTEEWSSSTKAISTQDDDEGLAVVAVPVPIVDPTLGNGLAPAALITFPTNGGDANTPRSTLGLVAAYTDKSSWIVGGGFALFLDGDLWRTKLNVGYGVLNLDYYGTSSDSIFFDNPASFEIKGSVVSASLQRRVSENFYLGGLLRHINSRVAVKVPIDIIPSFGLNLDLAGVGILATYDTRNSTWFPTSGEFANATFIHYSSKFGFERNFNTLEVDYGQYWTFSDDVVLAAQARFAHAGKEAPFFMFPFLNFRGFPAGKYLNRTAVQGQTELRWSFWKGLGAVGFAGAGVVSESFADLGDGSKGYGFGAGLRYRVSDADQMNIGLDVSYGSDDEVAVYFKIGEAF